MNWQNCHSSRIVQNTNKLAYQIDKNKKKLDEENGGNINVK